MPRLTTILFAVFLTFSTPSMSHAQVAGGQSGYDTTLEAIEPTGEAVSLGLAGDNPADIGRYVLAQNGGASDPRLSPDGQSIAFRWSVTGRRQLWVVPSEGGQPRQLTFGRGITFFRWMPDGQSLIYGADNDGNEQEAYYRIAASGDAERQVVPPVSGGFRVFGDFASENTIVFASTERNKLDFDIYVADLSSGDQRLVYEGKYAYRAPSVSPDSRFAVLSEGVGEDSENLYLLDLASGALETISAPDRRANHVDGGIKWMSDASGFFLSSNRERDFAALMFYRLDGGFELVEEAQGDIRNVTLCGEDDRFLAWTLNDRGYSRLFVRDRASDSLLETPDLPEGVYTLNCEGSPARLAVGVNGWKTPGDVLVWDLEGGDVHHPFEANLAGLDADRLVRPQAITLPARDGVDIHGLLYLPDASSRTDNGPPPVVFIVHGGPTAQSRPTFRGEVQYQVDRGLAVFQPNVRGSTGFGHEYVTLDDREKRLDSIRDLVDMLEYLGAEGLVDQTRAAVKGGSYGGYAVNAVLAAFPGHFAVGVSLFGVADWVTALEVASPALKASDLIEYGDIRDPKWRAFYEENSPIRLADRITVPVLYSHGVMDPRIDISETETMVRALRANGIEAPFIRFTDEGHGWRKVANQLFYNRYEARFLEEMLGRSTENAP